MAPLRWLPAIRSAWPSFLALFCHGARRGLPEEAPGHMPQGLARPERSRCGGLEPSGVYQWDWAMA